MSVREIVERALVGALLTWAVPVVLHLAGRLALRAGREGAANWCARHEDRAARFALVVTEYVVIAAAAALAVMQ